MQFGKNARVCFIGDSLTAQNQVLSRVIDFYKENLQEDNVTFFNCGVPGGTCFTAIDYFEKDILRHKPTHAIVAYGINDAAFGAFKKKMDKPTYDFLERRYEDFKRNLHTLYDMLKANGVEIIWGTPAPYDEYSEHGTPKLEGGSALVSHYAEFVRSFAREKNIALCDYHAYLSKVLRTSDEIIYREDRVHPNDKGYFLMAKCLLKSLGFDIGEEKEIPAYLHRWMQAISIMRRIYVVENMFPVSMPVEEKMQKVESILNAGTETNPYVVDCMHLYLKEIKNLDAIYAEIDKIYQEDIK